MASELKMTVRELGARMDGAELIRWMHFLQIRAHPGPAETKEQQAARLMGEIAAEKIAAAKRRGG